MNIMLWVLQVPLSLPASDMVEQMNSSISPAFRMFIGVAEVLEVGADPATERRLIPNLTWVD